MQLRFTTLSFNTTAANLKNFSSPANSIFLFYWSHFQICHDIIFHKYFTLPLFLFPWNVCIMISKKQRWFKMASSQKFTMMFTCIKGHKAKNWQFSWFVLKFFFLRQYYFTWNGQEVAPGLKKLTSGRTQRKTLYVEPNSRTIVALSFYWATQNQHTVLAMLSAHAVTQALWMMVCAP